MGVPVKKVTRKTISTRQSTHKINHAGLVKCSNCSNLISPHTICSYCGFYKGKKVLEIKVKEKKEAQQ